MSATAAVAATAAGPTTSAPLHTISILVRNKPGVLVRIALVFARRGYNIESLVVSTDVANGDFSRMTITCSGDPETLEQIIKQVTKLIDVVHAFDHTGQAVYETEVGLVKLKCAITERTEILQIAELYSGKVVDYGLDSFYMQEGKSRRVEEAIRQRRLVQMQVAVASSGQARIKTLLIDGVAVDRF